MKTDKVNMALFLVLFNVFVIIAQNSFEVIEKPLPYSKMANSFTVNIIGYNEDFVMAEWQKYITGFGGLTYIKSLYKGVIDMESKGVVFPLLNNNRVTLYTRFSPNDSLTGVLLTVWIEKQDGNFFSSVSNKTEAKLIKDWLFEFQKKIRFLNKRIRHTE